MNGYQEVVELLVIKGYNPDIVDMVRFEMLAFLRMKLTQFGRKPIHWAAIVLSQSTYNYLLGVTSSASSEDKFHLTPESYLTDDTSV